MTIYRNPELWVDYFNGIYIKPAQEDPSGEGNLFATNLAESGLLMYTRSRNRTDPTLIQDTITASYLFYREDDPTAMFRSTPSGMITPAPRSIRPTSTSGTNSGP